MSTEKNCVEIPEYFNEKFFETALKDGLHEPEICIKNLSITMGSSPGENYCSDIYRVQIIYNTAKEKNVEQWVIIKHLTIIAKSNDIRAMGVYYKEVAMYKEVIPKIEGLFKNTKFAAKCFYTMEKPIPAMVYQDLKVLGYEIGNREVGLGFDESKVLISKLAKFHAGSFVVADKDPRAFDKFNFGIFRENLIDTDKFRSVFQDSLAELIKRSKNWPGFENITEKLQNVHTNFKEKVFNNIKEKPGQLNVLNHGDVWVNNFMFKYVNGKPVDVIFVDLQISFYSSPGIDVNYFLNTSLQLEVMKNHRKELVDFYCNEFVNSLKDLNFKSPPGIEKVKAEIDSKEFYGFVSCVGVLPLVTMERKHTADNNIEMMIDENKAANKREIIFASKRFVNTIKFILKRCDELNVFDN